MIKVKTTEVVEWLTHYDGSRFQGILSDPPYALISMSKRFGKEDAAPAKYGADGRFSRLSKGFMGETWDGFNSLEEYQEWVTLWGTLLIERALYPGARCLFYGGTRTWHRLSVGLEDAGFNIYDTIMWVYGQGFPKSHKTGEGRGTGLKPAWEPIIVAQAPRKGMTYKKLLELYGTGSYYIDGSRIPSEKYTINTFDKGAKPWGDASGEEYTGRQHTGGRWPANLLLDETSAERLDEQTGELKSGKNRVRRKEGTFLKHGGLGKAGDVQITYGDSGGASRFFYCAKASKKEKGEYNTHPTVKPIDLNRYLSTLILPPKDKRNLLVPFSGSGSEIIGAYLAGWENITGLEMDLSYNKITERRLQELEEECPNLAFQVEV